MAHLDLGVSLLETASICHRDYQPSSLHFLWINADLGQRRKEEKNKDSLALHLVYR